MELPPSAAVTTGMPELQAIIADASISQIGKLIAERYVGGI
ncbi:hypothetical protein [Treponema phagedenis]|nr:hypothetical protein [Treponema phagedenis]EFW36711.1 hypothetical protein HMPREF9554_02827 [Treponema phagedenis F0421]